VRRLPATRREVSEENGALSPSLVTTARTPTAYLDGVLDARPLDPWKDKRTDPYLLRWARRTTRMTLLSRPWAIFKYDPALHAASKPGGGADFTAVPATPWARCSRGTMGKFAGLASSTRALTDAELEPCTTPRSSAVKWNAASGVPHPRRAATALVRARRTRVFHLTLGRGLLGHRATA